MRSLETPVLSHWHKQIDNFHTSSLDFYAAVEAAIKARELPEVRISRVEYQEGGILSPARVYLRIERRRHAFDICAAPFGRGFFFSSWLVEPKPKIQAWGCLVFLVALALIWLIPREFGYTGCLIALLIAFLAAFVTLLGVRGGWLFSEDLILSIPYLGVIYEYFFSPATYYRYDTALMFRDSAHNAVLEVVDGALAEKGLRALAPEDRTHVMRSLVGR
jgi:hypothetical protein